MQASVPRIANLVAVDRVNVIEFYNCPTYLEDPNSLYTLDLSWSHPAEFFSLDNPQEEIQYYHRDMCYIFDVNSDAQRSFRRILQEDQCYRNFYVAAFHEEQVPSHRFPSTQDIHATVRLVRYTQKIHARLSWIYEQHEKGGWVSYLRYQHAPQVDMDTIQKELERTLARMPKPTPKARTGLLPPA